MAQRPLPIRQKLPANDAERPCPHPMSPKDMIGMVRVGSAVVSPDGSLVVIAAKEYDFDAGKWDEHLYVMQIDQSAGHMRRLTGTKNKSNNSPQFSPDGDHVAFLSNRSGSTQIWVLPVRGPGEAQQLTELADSIGDLVWDSNGLLLFSCSVYIDIDDSGDPIKATADRDKAAEEDKVSAVLFSSLPVRQWDRWLDEKRTHIFKLPVTFQDGVWCTACKPVDLLAGSFAECPVPAFGGSEDFSTSSTHVAMSMRPPLTEQHEAWSTNRHIYVKKLGDTTGLGDCITDGNDGYDLAPAFSPDGRYLVWLSMATPQYESDAERLKLKDLQDGSVRNLAADWDYSPSGVHWSKDCKSLFFSANIRARGVLCSLDVGSGAISELVKEGSNAFCGELPGGRLVYTHTSLCEPTEVWVCDADGSSQTQLTFFNKSRLSNLTLGVVKDISFVGAKNEQVQAWLVLPAGIPSLESVTTSSLPMGVVIHGGPQGAIADSWHYRWHLQTYAAKGFLTLAINFHGSTGFGHEFCRSISGDWGGAPFEDIMAGCQHVLKEYPCVDPGRVCALGASYGGYMINYLNGNAPRGFFKCFVCHDGLFNLESSYYATEELFFMEFEFKGVPWQATESSSYKRFSPHLKADQWKTPTLVIHGAKDYRICESEGISAFTALQRQGVPSELLLFPSENHWVLNPLNSLVWHERVLSWLDRWAFEGQAAKGVQSDAA